MPDVELKVVKKTVLIGYDLNKPAKDYSGLIKLLQEVGTWWHHLDSTWLLRTNLELDDLYDRLDAVVDADDEILILDVTGCDWVAHGFKQRGIDWLAKHL